MPHLLIKNSDGTEVKRELSRTQPLSIGRQSFNDICIDEPGVSAMHCRISRVKSGAEVVAASPQGVTVNGQSVQHYKLSPGDVIRVGSLDLVFGTSKRPADASADEPDVPKELAPPAEPSLSQLSEFSGEVAFASEVELELPQKSKARPKDRGSIFSGPRRPGEQDVTRSPVILGLIGGGTGLLLLAGIVWFLIGREQVSQLVQAAEQDAAEGRYTQAIGQYETFLKKYPGHRLTRSVMEAVGKTKIQRELSGTAPAWNRGLEQLQAFIRDRRDDADFSKTYPDLRQYAEQIARGAAQTAELTFDPKLLEISREGQAILERYQDPANPPVTALERITAAYAKADQAIFRKKILDESVLQMQASLANRVPTEALALRAGLLARFPQFEKQPAIKEVLTGALEMATKVVTVNNTDVPAKIEGPEKRWPTPTTLVFNTRTRTDETSDGTWVLARAPESLFGIDAITGEPLWQRGIGPDSPLLPQRTGTGGGTLLTYNTRFNRLEACEAQSAKTTWVQPLARPIAGQPMIYEGQMFVACNNQSIYRVSIDTGLISAEVKFPQKLSTQPVLLKDQARLVVAGEANLLYQLMLRPFEIESVTFTGHSSQSVAAPLMAMGELLMMAENVAGSRTNLRMFDTREPRGPLKERPGEQINGRTKDAGALRGSVLVVPSAPERLSGFFVSDEPSRVPLRPAGTYQNVPPVDYPVHVALGPQDQFWMQGGSFRRFEIKSDGLKPDPNPVVPGRGVQPLQQIGDQFYVVRQPMFAKASIVTQADRDKLTIPWRTTVGGDVIALTQLPGDNLLYATSAGGAGVVSANRLSSGGFEWRSMVELPIPAATNTGLFAAGAEGRLVVAANLPTGATVFVVNSVGQAESTLTASAPLVASPILLADCIALPVDGQILRLPYRGSGSSTGGASEPWGPLGDEPLDRQWTSVNAAGPKELVVVSRSGKLTRLQSQANPNAILAQVAQVTLADEVEVPAVVSGGSIYVVDAGRTLRRFDVSTFEPQGEGPLEGEGLSLGVTNELALVVLSNDEVVAFGADNGLKQLWKTTVTGFMPAGQPMIVGEHVWWAGRAGELVRLSMKTGEVIERVAADYSMTLGLVNFGQERLAVAADGVIYRVNSLLEGQP